VAAAAKETATTATTTNEIKGGSAVTDKTLALHWRQQRRQLGSSVVSAVAAARRARRWQAEAAAWQWQRGVGSNGDEDTVGNSNGGRRQ
jgi:hypothetical protein